MRARVLGERVAVRAAPCHCRTRCKMRSCVASGGAPNSAWIVVSSEVSGLAAGLLAVRDSDKKSASNSPRTQSRWRSSATKKSAQLAKPIATAIRARSSSDVGKDWVWVSSRYCRRCSSSRKKTYAVCNAATREGVINCRAPISLSASRVERVCSALSRPPRINWCSWATNSIWRMPPTPTLILSS